MYYKNLCCQIPIIDLEILAATRSIEPSLMPSNYSKICQRLQKSHKSCFCGNYRDVRSGRPFHKHVFDLLRLPSAGIRVKYETTHQIFKLFGAQEQLLMLIRIKIRWFILKNIAECQSQRLGLFVR